MSSAPSWASTAQAYEAKAAVRPVAERLPYLPAEDAHQKASILLEVLEDRSLTDKQARAIALEALREVGAFTMRLRVQKWTPDVRDVYAAGSVAVVDRVTAERWAVQAEAVPADARTAEHLKRLGLLGVRLLHDRRIGGQNYVANEEAWLPTPQAQGLVAHSLAVYREPIP